MFDSFVAGASHLKDTDVLKQAKIGDTLPPRRESDNQFDSCAIMVQKESGRKYGYVPEKDCVVFSRLRDAVDCSSLKLPTFKSKGLIHDDLDWNLFS